MRLHALLHFACIVVPMQSESKSRGGGFDPNWEEALASPGLRHCACVRRALFSKMFLLHLMFCLSPCWPVMRDDAGLFAWGQSLVRNQV